MTPDTKTVSFMTNTMQPCIHVLIKNWNKYTRYEVTCSYLLLACSSIMHHQRKRANTTDGPVSPKLPLPTTLPHPSSALSPMYFKDYRTGLPTLLPAMEDGTNDEASSSSPSPS